MTELTLFKASNLPAHLRGQELSETTKALMGSGSGGKRISIKGGVFRLVSGGKELAQIEDRHLDVIVVKAAPKVARQYYENKYDPENPAPPDCWSNDGEKPDPTAKKRQSDTCAKCRQNIAGSGQGESRACRYQQRLAVMVADDMESGVYQLALPATSLFGKEEGDKRPLQAYARFLAVQTPPVDIGAVVTRMKFDTRSESPKLFFAPVRWLDEGEYHAAKEAGGSPEAKAAVVMTVAAQDGVTETSRPAPMQIEGKRPDEVERHSGEANTEPVSEKPRKPRQVKPTAEEVETDEPEKRKPAAKAEASVPVKDALANAVAKWDDE